MGTQRLVEWREIMTLLQIEENNAHKRVIVCLTFLGKIPRIATGNNCCIKMWQS